MTDKERRAEKLRRDKQLGTKRRSKGKTPAKEKRSKKEHTKLESLWLKYKKRSQED